MELVFTGRGAMLNPQEGNTAAYFEDNNNFYLIDCGEDVAKKLIEKGKLDQDKEYYLMITHTHSDHIGSLGTLQQYLYWCKGKKLKILISKDMVHLESVKKAVEVFGLEEDTLEYVDVNSLDFKSETFNKIRYIPSSHGDVSIKSCSILINSKNGDILYTGDIADSKVIEWLISASVKIDKIYVDSSLKGSPVHLSIYDLRKIIPEELNNNIYCMHIDDERIEKIAKNFGFHIVSIETFNKLNVNKEIIYKKVP